MFRRHVDAALHFADYPETLFPTVLTSHVHRCPAWNKLQQFSVTCLVLSGGSRISQTRVRQSHKVERGDPNLSFGNFFSVF